MSEHEIQVGRKWDSRSIARAIESAAKSHDLQIALKGTLQTCRGCTHWHFKNGRNSGTLEATMWPKEKRVWLSVQSGRRAVWIERDLPAIVKQLQAALEK
jgi:hypothetical protein